MNQQVFRNISKIIERDSKSTTYKFALLRGVIDITQENSPFIQKQNGKVTIPLGLLIEKWLVYYYPILESDIIIPQINGNSRLAFQEPFSSIIDFYKTRGGLSSFYNELRNKRMPQDIMIIFGKLIKTMAYTIVDKPMRYIGRSISSSE